MTDTNLPPVTNDNTPPREPMLNIPPLTLGLLALFIAIFLCTSFAPHIIGPYLPYLCFIPNVFSHEPLLFAHTILSYALLHFGWAHIVMNGFGLVAFGSGVERICGKKWFLLVFLGGVICGALGHWALFPASMNPLGGASAGISALFGALLPLVIRRDSLLQAIGVFAVMNLVFGLMGMPGQAEGASIAWQAHMAGFIWGLAATLALIRFKARKN